jgi:hypothetical protein
MEKKALAILLSSVRNRRHTTEFAVVGAKTQAGFWLRTDQGDLPYAVYPEDVVIIADGDWSGQGPSEIMKTLPLWAQEGFCRLKDEISRLHSAANGR